MNRPLIAGSVISYGSHQAIVKEDQGTRVLVDVNGREELWYWEFQGETCQVVSLPAVAGTQGVPV